MLTTFLPVIKVV